MIYTRQTNFELAKTSSLHQQLMQIVPVRQFTSSLPPQQVNLKVKSKVAIQHSTKELVMAKRYEDYFKNKRKELSKNLNQCLKPIRNKNEVSFERLDLLDIKGLNLKQSYEKIVVDTQTPNGRKRKLTFKIKPNSVQNEFLRHSEYLPRLIDQKLI